ncbi:MAG: lytic transglycosylase domain-containing protein [Actinomycetia bacterium]|nr:lytic transglycosylase domain-containing protein [Actinomycetes bacterium]
MSREHPLSLHRALPVIVIVALGALLFLALRGPVWWQRVYHPLRYETAIAASAEKNGIDPYLIAAVINAESGFDRTQVSSAGAVGLMQLMPTTAMEVVAAEGFNQSVNAENLKAADLNIALGSRHLADLLGRYTDTQTALAAYNAGSGNVDRWMSEQGVTTLTVAGFSETRAYVERVLSERARYAELYPHAFGGK